jgi:hypothetical protein
MTSRESDLIYRRLHNQRLPRSSFRAPEEVVAWLGAVQAQDYPGARWGVGQRAIGINDADVERAFDEGRILRTHVMRPTWHFVAPADIRWIQALTAPRVHSANSHYYRKVGLDGPPVARSGRIVERALRDGRQLTRTELADALQRGGIPAKGQQLAYLMMQAELDQLICSGARRGKQFTYALLEERVPRAPALTGEEALAELTKRYFSSHGPATVRDYVWWSGLTVREARTGLDLLEPAPVRQTVGDCTYYYVASKTSRPPTSPSAWLVPNYDEFLIAYQDRSLTVGTAARAGAPAATFDPFAHFLVVDGTLAGTWRRTQTRESMLVRVVPNRRLTRAERGAVAAAAERYGAFVKLRVDLSIA